RGLLLTVKSVVLDGAIEGGVQLGHVGVTAHAAVSRALGRALAPAIARLVARTLLGRRTEDLAIACVELLLQKRELLLDREDRILAARDGELLRELEQTLVQPRVLGL